MSILKNQYRSIYLGFCGIILALSLTHIESGAEENKHSFQGEEIILEGLALSYRMELVKALEVFKKLKAVYPDSPAAQFYPAAISWGAVESDLRWRQIARLHAKTDIEREMPTGSAERLLIDMRETIAKCAKILEDKPDDFEALFYTAGAYGFSARMEYYSGSYFSALVDGKKSADFFEQLFAKHPDRADAKLAPGIYKYYIGGLSGPMRYLISILGLKGSSEEGLALMEDAARNSILSKVEATDFLTRIYRTREGDTKKALAWSEELNILAPESPLSDFHRLIIFHKLNDRQMEEQSARALLDKISKLHPNLKTDWEPLLNFTICAAMEEGGEAKKGIEYCRKAYESPDAGKWLKSEIKQHLKWSPLIKNVP